MSVHYKFKSTLDYNTVTFDGLHISVADLKKAIFQQNRIGKSGDFDLLIENAESKESYADENALIPKNASVIVCRVPIANLRKRTMTRRGADEASVPENNIASFSKDLDLSQLDGTETEKIKIMMAQSTHGYDPSTYMKIRGGNQFGDVPMNYRCYRCQQPGHWIKNCPFGRTLGYEIKKSTGIPASSLIFVDGPDVPGAKLTPHGRFAVSTVDYEAYKEGKKEKPPFLKESEPEVIKVKPPADLICHLCEDVMTEAIMVPCCGESYCDECIRNHLLDLSDNPSQQCPACKEENVSPANLIPNRYLRTSAAKFRAECQSAGSPLPGQSSVTESSPTSNALAVAKSASPIQVPTEQRPESTISPTSVKNVSLEDDAKKSPSSREEEISPETIVPNSAAENIDEKLENQGTDAPRSEEEKSLETEHQLSPVAPALVHPASPIQTLLEQQPEAAAPILTTCDLVEPPPPPGTEPVPIPEVGSWPSRSHDLSHHRDRNYEDDQMMGNNSYGEYRHGDMAPGYHQRYDRRRSIDDRPGTPTVDEPGSNYPVNHRQPILPYPPGEDHLPGTSYGQPPMQMAHGNRDLYMNRGMAPMYPQTGEQQHPSGHHYDPSHTAGRSRYDRPLYYPNYSRPYHHHTPRQYNHGAPKHMRGMHHHNRQYDYRGQPAPPGLSRDMIRSGSPQVIIDDPVAAFERIMRQKDERRELGKSRRRHASRSRSRSYSRSRSPFDQSSSRVRSRSPNPEHRRSLQYSHHPPRHGSSSHRARNSRSPTPQKRKRRSNSFSKSRSHSYSPREKSRSPRGSPNRDRERGRPRERAHERETAPSRYRSPGRSYRERDRERRRSRERRDSLSRDEVSMASRNPSFVPRQQQSTAMASTFEVEGRYPPPLMSLSHSRASPQGRKDYYDSYNRHRAEEKSRDRRDRDRRGNQHEAAPEEKEQKRDYYEKYDRHSESGRKRRSKLSPPSQDSANRRSKSPNSSTIFSGEHVKKEDKEYEEKQSASEADKKKEKKTKDKKRKKDSEESSSLKKEKKKKKKEKKMSKERLSPKSPVQEFGNKLLASNPEPPELSDDLEEFRRGRSPQEEEMMKNSCIANPPNPKGFEEDEFLAEVPELSKWEREEMTDVASNPTTNKAKISVAETDTAKQSAKVVTSEVLKRAENAIFQRANNLTIRPIEIKKISDNRKILYQNPEVKVMKASELVEAAWKDMNVTVKVETNDKNVKIVADSSTAKKTKTPVSECGGFVTRLSAKERLGAKIEEPENSEVCARDNDGPDSTTNLTVLPELPMETTVADVKEKSEMPSNFASGDRKREPERIEPLKVGERRSSVREGHRDNSTPPLMSVKSSQAEHQALPEKAKVFDEDDDDRKDKKKRSRSHQDRKKRKKPKKDKSKDRSPDIGSGDASDDKEKMPGKSTQEPAEDESKKAQLKNSLKKRGLFDEANFEPDYSADSLSVSEAEQGKAPSCKKMKLEQHEKKTEGKKQKKKKRPAKSSSSDDDSSSSSESLSDSDSSDSEPQRKKRSGKKKHGKNKKKKKSKKESTTDESDSDSSDSSSEADRRASRKRKKSKRKKQKRNKLRHKY